MTRSVLYMEGSTLIHQGEVPDYNGLVAAQKTINKIDYLPLKINDVSANYKVCSTVIAEPKGQPAVLFVYVQKKNEYNNGYNKHGSVSLQ